MSQYDLRDTASPGVPQNQQASWCANGNVVARSSILYQRDSIIISSFGIFNFICSNKFLVPPSARMLVGTCGDEPGTNCKAEATADALSLDYESFCDESKSYTPQKYLLWIKRQIIAGNPVLIGTYVNQWMDNEDSDPFAGQGVYAQSDRDVCAGFLLVIDLLTNFLCCHLVHLNRSVL